MSQENVEFVRAGYAKAGGLGSEIAPDAEFDFTDLYPDQPVLRGIEALRRFREQGPWGGSRLHFEPERFFDVDEERVLVFVRVTPLDGRAAFRSRSKPRMRSQSATV